MAEPSLSPDHREIAFVSGGDIWTVPFAGGDARLLISHPATDGRPLWSPDGTRLAFTSNRTGNGDVYVLTFATGDVQRLTFDDVNDVLDNWSHDGTWLYFSSTSRDVAGMSDVWRVRASGGTPTQVAGDTSNGTLLDGTTVRLPGTRITGADGKDMEMNPRPVDVLVVRPVGESYSGRDSQLDAAVKVLLAPLPARR